MAKTIPVSIGLEFEDVEVGSLSLDIDALTNATAGILKDNDVPASQAARIARTNVDTLIPALATQLRQWLTAVVVYEPLLRASKPDDIQTLLLEPSGEALIGVPAVKDVITHIRRTGSRDERLKMGNAITAYSGSGRPRQIGNDALVKHAFERTRTRLEPISAAMEKARRDGRALQEIWSEVEREYPSQAQRIQSAGLHDQWFSDAVVPKLEAMTIELLVREHVGWTAATIQRIARSKTPRTSGSHSKELPISKLLDLL